MQPFPDAIQIGPFAYSVWRDQALMDKARAEAESSELVGQTNHHTLRILVDPETAAGVQRESLLHEVLHGVCLVAGWRGGKRTQERVLEELGPVLLDTLRRNPALVRALLWDDRYPDGGPVARALLEALAAR